MKVVWAVFTLLVFSAGCSGPAAPPSAPAATAPAHRPSAAAPESAAVVTVPPASVGNFATEAVKEQSVAEGIRATGHLTVNDHRTWRVGAIIDGHLVNVMVNAGDRVAAGQVLARMHSHAVHDGRADHRKALTELGRAKSAVAYAEQMRDRAKRLYALKAAALEQVERTEAEVKQAQSAVTQAETEVDRAKTHLADVLGVAVEERAGESHDHDDDLISVKAPAAGVLLERKVTAGSVVAAAAEMFVISDVSTLWMQAALPEAAISGVRFGQAVRVEVQAHPGRSFPGRVIKLGEQLDADTRTLPVQIELANAAGLLKPEMYGDVQWASGAAGGGRGGLFVSETALQDVKGQSTVFVETGAGRFEARAVETGRLLDGRVQILSGVAAGETVVVKGAFVLKSQVLKKALADEE
ncbi:MAG: efflux RND transporter periplasmic adaptor subunit [Acidobacteria bacterium]|nr:efflux RND transporter periplasmic adaptor subunit [Acidobacteriota bacterium]